MLNTRMRSLGLAAAGLILLVYPDPPTSSAPVPDLPPPPSVEELARLEELAGWVFGAPGQLRLSGGALTLSEAIRDRRQSFELFRRFPREAARQDLLLAFPYGDLIQDVSERTGVDGLLLAAVVEAESSFDPLACSRDGALGLMQLLPSTAADMGTFDLSRPRANVEAGALYLRLLLDRYDQDLEMALAAYNAGPGNVDRFDGVPPFPETERYVERVLSTYVEHHRSLWQRDRELRELLATVRHDA